MTGDAVAIMRLYREMTGEEQPEDLSRVWPVRLGEATEQLNLDWLEQSGVALVRRGHVITHPRHDWAACTIDAWCVELDCPCEAKHVGGREPLEIVVERYQPQMQWQMECTGATQCVLSVIMGANPPVVEYIRRDEEYAAEMVRRGRQFMTCVSNLQEPVALPAVPAPVDATKVIDMTGNNMWADNAAVWLAVKDAAAECETASKILKATVPADAKKAWGHGVRITRDRAGRLSLREDT
jgi:predicted phage-related endonuclease